MATGLATFDAFSWASLLKGRRILVVDRDRARGRAVADGLEEAGAETTIASSQAIALDRLSEGPFRHVLVRLDAPPAQLRSDLAERLSRAGRGAILVADASDHESLRAICPAARLATPSLDERSLVMLLADSADD